MARVCDPRRGAKHPRLGGSQPAGGPGGGSILPSGTDNPCHTTPTSRVTSSEGEVGGVRRGHGTAQMRPAESLTLNA